MKTYLKYAAMIAATIGLGSVLTACQDDFDEKPVASVTQEPKATLQPNISILDLKKACWKDDTNYIFGMENKEDAPFVPLGTKEDGEHYIIAGRVISSDEQSNVYKSLVIQDGTAAIAMSVNRYNLYQNYRIGQEIVVDVTGMYIGKYNGLLQIGYPSWYANGNTWNASFMSPELFTDHIELNGWPDAAKVDTLVVNSFSDLPSGPDGLMKWQSQLVRFNNVEFTDGGKEPFGVYQVSGTNRALTDVNGTSLNVRTSGYSTFWNKTLPAGRGDVVAICSYYGTDGWQLILNGYDGCMNFGNPTLAPGAEDNPYTVDQAIADQNMNRVGWVTGYIVGTVMPEPEGGKVTTNADVDWSGTEDGKFIVDNSLVIGQTPETRDLAHCLVIDLPVGSPLQRLGNLADHADNYGKQIWIRGTLASVLGHAGITNNNGASGTWRIDGVTDGGEVTPGTGTEEDPYSVATIIGFNPSSTQTSDHPGVWVKGYIVGWANMSTEYFINANTATFSVPATMKTNILVAESPDVTDYTKCIGIQLPSGNVRNALNLQDNPQLLGQQVLLKGDVMKYSGIPGLKNTSEFKLDGSTPDPDPTPDNPVTSLDENFNAATAIPAGWTIKKIAGDKDWYVREFNGDNYATVSGYKGNAPFDAWLISPALDLNAMASKVLTFDTQVNGYGSTTSNLRVFVLTSANPEQGNRTALNATFAEAPASGYSSWVGSGNIDLSAFSGVVYIGWQYTATQDANYATWCVDNVKLNAGGTPTPDPDPDPDPTPSGEYKGDFNSFNGGAAKASPYGTYTNATGWTAENAIILGGTDGADANPLFTFIGATGTLAPTLNGRTDKLGKLTSPVLTGGIGTLTFSYGFAFTETKCQFRVDVKDANGNVVKTDTVTLDSIEKAHAYSYSLECNVSGNFTIEISNLGYSGTATGNKDRLSIWNLTWTSL